MKDSIDIVATNVRAMREKKKLTQPQLAEMAGVNINTIFRLERKLGYPSWGTIARVAQALGVKAETLLKK